MKSYRFELPAKCNVKTISIRETDGKDESEAAEMAEAKGKSRTVTDELVRLAIVKVNGKPVPKPFSDYDHWNTKTRRAVFMAWLSVNGMDEKEQDFLERGVDEDALAEQQQGVSGDETSGEPG